MIKLSSLHKETIIVAAEEILGDQAASVIKRIRSAPNTPEALRDAAGQCHAIIETTVGGKERKSIAVICSA